MVFFYLTVFPVQNPFMRLSPEVYGLREPYNLFNITGSNSTVCQCFVSGKHFRCGQSLILALIPSPIPPPPNSEHFNSRGPGSDWQAEKSS